MSQHFTHLHVHTDYSLLDGAITLDRFIDFGKKHNFKALAITDHGNVFGAVKFFQKCKKANIKPILGIEAYLTEDINQKAVEKKYYHIILLVQNNTGYKNLCKLISFAYQQGFYFKPRIDYAILEQYSEGLIATSGCLGGHIPQLLKQGNTKEAERVMDWYLKIFGPERFYFEIQPEDQQEQAVLNKQLYIWSAQKNIPLLATADCHYVDAEDREAHEVMLAIQTQSKMSDADRFTFGDCRVHLRTTEQMLELFPEHPDAIWNAGKIADMCNFDFKTDSLFFPKFEIPKEHTPESFFAQLCKNGLQNLINDNLIEVEKKQEYWDRLHVEIDLIIKMGFVGYFLVVSDFIQWGKKEGIPVGPGRGSAAGSLVAWALQITNIDPLRYNLLFERFLNPERISMPDIDIDFCIEGREKIINYVKNKYGHDKVGQIITFGTMMAKGVVKDVARALGIPFEDSNHITGLIPDQLKITLQEAIEQEPRLKELIDSNAAIKKLFDLAFRLEGITRHASKHAAGIVISPEPIDEVLPIYIPPKTQDIVTQYAMTELESIGFLKIDLLGLKNLTLIDKVIRLIKQNYGISINMDKLPLDDPKAFALMGRGDTSGVFQLESDGLKDVLRKLQPEKFEDIIAVNALYRPGPLGSGMVDDFIERKHGRQKISYLFDELAPILQETYGVIVYQEQVMKIASAIAGYSLGESDILRRAMGKKKAEVMAEQRELFLNRAKERGFDGKKAGELFDLMAYFAGYGFNKSHSAAYALIAYQTAYLKANYPAEFMASLISLESGNADKMSFYLSEAKDMHLPILPPNINTSNVNFIVVANKILFGLQGIKNVGGAALENIIKERNERGSFKDMLDFCVRVDMRTVNKRVIESLIYAGAFDTLTGNRAQKHEELATIFEQAVARKRAIDTGQMGLFDNSHSTDARDFPPYAFTPKAEWNNKEKLEREKEAIGFYLSAHPMDTYKQYISSLSLISFEELFTKYSSQNFAEEPIVVGCGLLKHSKTIFTKKGDRMAFVQLEDVSSQAELVIFPKLFTKVESWLETYHVFLVRGFFDAMSQRFCKIKANDLVPLDLFFQEWSILDVFLVLPPLFTSALLTTLQANLVEGTIPLSFIVHEQGQYVRIQTKRKIALDIEKITAFEKEYNVRVKLRI